MNSLVNEKTYALIIAIILSCCTATANEFQVRVVDAETKRPISVKMSIRNSRGALIKQRGIPYHAGNFCFFGTHNFKLPRGVYSYTIEKGLEYRTVSGQFEIKRGANDGVTVSVPRFANMSSKGWWSGDLSVRRRLDDVPVLMDANDLNFANWIAQTNKGLVDRQGFPVEKTNQVNERIAFFQTGVIDRRAGGDVIWLGGKDQQVLDAEGSGRPHRIPESIPAGAMMIPASPAMWDLPVLLAEQRLLKTKPLGGIMIAGNRNTAKSTKKIQSQLRPIPDSIKGDHRFARWQIAIYFHLLNCGFQIPPVASSDSGESSNPVGFNRTYVHCGQKYSPEKWLDNLRQGRTMVTNGPIMNVLYNGLLPGETFLVDESKSIEIEPTLTLSLKEKANYLEIIRNGFVAKQVSLDEYAKARGRLPKVRFDESGWMAIRVVTNNKDAYRFALSGPIYVQVGQQKILKKESAQFFLDWMVERGRMLRKSPSADVENTIEQLRPAYEFWKEMATRQ